MKKRVKTGWLILIWAAVSVIMLLGARPCLRNIIQRDFIKTSTEGEMKKANESFIKYEAHYSPVFFESYESMFFEEPAKYGSKNLSMRELYKDHTIFTKDLDPSIRAKLFDFQLTTVYGIYNPEDPDSIFSFGTWQPVYVRKEKETLLQSRADNAFAAINTEKAMEEGYWKEITERLKNDNLASLRIDRYAIKGIELVPIDLTYQSSDESVSTYHPHDDSEFDSSWSIESRKNIYAFSPYQFDEFDHSTDYSYEITDRILEDRKLMRDVFDNIDWSDPDSVNSEEPFVKLISKENEDILITYKIFQNEHCSRPYAAGVCLHQSYNDVSRIVFLGAFFSWTFVFWTSMFFINMIRKRKPINLLMETPELTGTLKLDE